MQMKKLLFLLVFALSLSITAIAQEVASTYQTMLGGELLTVLVTNTNDTIYVKDMDGIQISSPRKFENGQEYRRYLKYKRYAAIVYPYAVEAIRIFREIDEDTYAMKKKKRKKHVKKLHKELKEEFTDPLKNLTKTQGKILVKMIEKELNTPLYDLIKGFRGNWTATYWNVLGNLNGFSLKEGYIKGQDHLLDAVLEDMDLSYPEHY
jgi:hypothetical protein